LIAQHSTRHRTNHVDAPTQLIPVFDRNIGGEGVQAVNARDLHAFLEVGKVFGAWITERIDQYGFVVGRDFEVFSETGNNPLGGRPAIEYALTLDMAKELAMVERNDQGKRARLYFIECERRAKSAAATLDLRDPKTLLRLLTQTAETAATLQSTVQEQIPKVLFFEAVAASGGAQGIGEVAKVLGTGRTRLFAFLRECGVLMEDNMPRQRHIEEGHLLVRQRVYTDANGESHTYSRVLVTGKGITYLQRRWTDRKQPAASQGARPRCSRQPSSVAR
jgi:anti-repressor protein